jgi:hypothetical protein
MAILPPSQGDKRAPTLGSSPLSLQRYFEDIEEIFTNALITADEEKKKLAVKYLDQGTEMIWTFLPSYLDPAKSYDDFKAAVQKAYPESDTSSLYSLPDLERLCQDTKQSNFDTWADYGIYHRNFGMIYRWLQANAKYAGLTNDTMSTWFLKGFSPALECEVLDYCRRRIPDQKRSIPFSMDLIHDGVHYALEDTTVSMDVPSTGIKSEAISSALPTLLAGLTQLIEMQNLQTQGA